MSNQLSATVEVNHFTHDHWRIGLWLHNSHNTSWCMLSSSMLTWDSQLLICYKHMDFVHTKLMARHAFDTIWNNDRKVLTVECSVYSQIIILLYGQFDWYRHRVIVSSVIMCTKLQTTSTSSTTSIQYTLEEE